MVQKFLLEQKSTGRRFNVKATSLTEAKRKLGKYLKEDTHPWENSGYRRLISYLSNLEKTSGYLREQMKSYIEELDQRHVGDDIRMNIKDLKTYNFWQSKAEELKECAKWISKLMHYFEPYYDDDDSTSIG